MGVALRKESVDRNRCSIKCAIACIKVALRKESVDRNKYVVQCRKVMSVALRKESVDRNFVPFSVIRPAIESLSARRAWIEIL